MFNHTCFHYVSISFNLSRDAADCFCAVKLLILALLRNSPAFHSTCASWSAAK